jgi:hypothetical protein
MRQFPRPYRLTFFLPRELGRGVPQGHHAPCADGCTVQVEPPGLVMIAGPSRDATFEQAARLLRIAVRRRPQREPLSIAAILDSPDPSGRDSWSIAVGADVAFSPTGLGVHFPQPETEPRPPPLRLVPSAQR